MILEVSIILFPFFMVHNMYTILMHVEQGISCVILKLQKGKDYALKKGKRYKSI